MGCIDRGMRAIFHVFFLCGYAGLAVAMAAYGRQWFSALDQGMSYGLGAAVLFGGALLHEAFARTGHDAELDQQSLVLSYGYASHKDELTWLRREVEALRKVVEAAAKVSRAGPGGGRIGGAMAEATVLKSLAPRLSTGGAQSVAITPAQGRQKAAPVPKLVRPKLAIPNQAKLFAAKPNPGAILDLVREALRDDRIDLVLQPIVSLPQRKRRFYECFSRLRGDTGRAIRAEEYIAVAEGAGLIAAIDNMLLFRCVQLIRKIQRGRERVDFFCNISPHTLADETFFTEFVTFLESNEKLASHLIFEFAQVDFLRWCEVGARLLDRLSALGCRFSLDHVTDLDLDPAMLARRRIHFIKIETSLLLEEVTRHGEMLGALRRHKIDVIVEKVEEEQKLIELLDHDIDFGQGFLFGKPRLARPAA